MTDFQPDLSVLDETTVPVRPKVVLNPDDVPQPREVQWGHLTQYTGAVRDDEVRITQQTRKHSFGEGTIPTGPRRPLYEGSLWEAHKVYKALEALFAGGVMEVKDDE